MFLVIIYPRGGGSILECYQGLKKTMLVWYVYKLLYKCHMNQHILSQRLLHFLYYQWQVLNSSHIYLPIQSKTLTLVNQEFLTLLGYFPIHPGFLITGLSNYRFLFPCRILNINQPEIFIHTQL